MQGVLCQSNYRYLLIESIALLQIPKSLCCDSSIQVCYKVHIMPFLIAVKTSSIMGSSAAYGQVVGFSCSVVLIPVPGLP